MNMKCTVHALKAVGSNSGRVSLGVHSTSSEVVLEPKVAFKIM